MNKYKIEFTKTETFIVDVLAKNEAEAKIEAEKKFKDIVSNNMDHYHQTGDSETVISTVFDVTGTDDPFNP